MSAPDANLLDFLVAARRGDQGAARLLWARLSPRLLALARELLTTDAAVDVVQGVFLSLLKLPEARLRAVDDLAAFAVISTRNDCRNANRAAAREKGRLVGALRLHRETASAVSLPVAPAAGHQSLYAALDRLDEDARELLILKHVGGLTFDQLALCLGEPRGTLTSRYQRALKLLRETLSSRERDVAENTPGQRAVPVVSASEVPS